MKPHPRWPASMILFLFLILTPGMAAGCSCTEPPDPKTALGEATAVFTGRVLQVRPSGEFENAILFRVNASWKGMDERLTEVNLPNNDGICGFRVAEGDSFMVYAYANAGSQGLGTHLCTRTRRVAAAGEDFKAFGKPPVSFADAPSRGAAKGSNSTTGAKNPALLKGLQTIIAGRWESLDDKKQQLEVEATGPKTGIAYFWDANGEYLAPEYEITGKDRIRWRTASSIRITVKRDGDRMTWRMEDEKGIKLTVTRTFRRVIKT